MIACVPNARQVDERQEILLDCDAEDADGEMQTLLSLTGEQSMRRTFSVRSVSSAHVLRCFSYAFAENSKPQTEAEALSLFRLSRETDAVEHFLSHSWGAGRYLKWAALCSHYHRGYGVCLAHLTWFIISCAGIIWRMQTGIVCPFLVSFPLATLTPCLVAIAFTAWGQSCCTRLGSQVFLDRLCIHQWDEELKALGVRSLGEVLGGSKNFLVLWSEDYLDRLWCIFEIATFCSRNKGSNGLILLPLWQTPFLYAVLIICTCAMFCGALSEEIFSYDWSMATFGIARGIAIYWCIWNFIPACFICVNIRLAFQRKVAMENTVANFELAYTKLSCEEDRDFIYGHIRKLFGTLDEFEELVRTDLLHSLQKVIGEAWQLPYSWGIFAFQPFLWYLSADSLSMSDAGAQLYGCANWKVYYLADVLFFGIIYLAMPLTLKVAGCSLNFTQKWSFARGLVADVTLFLATLFWIVYFSTSMYSLVFLRTLDTSLFAPLVW